MEMKLIKENKKGKTFQAEGFKILYRYKDKTWIIESPAKVEFPANTYHKIKALTDISFILFEK